MAVIEHVDLSKRVYERLKAMILSGELAPGQKIVQEKLAQAIGVSRTPLLKALQVLEHEMLVESVPRRGIHVKEMEDQEIIDAFDCREAIEGVAVRLATERASDRERHNLRGLFEPFRNVHPIPMDPYQRVDQRFHGALIALSRNTTIQRIEVMGNIHIISYNRGLIRSPEETLPEHFAIIEAIEERDGSLAETRLREHLRTSRERVRQALERTQHIKATGS